MKEVVASGRTVEDAKLEALRELGVDSEKKVEVEIIDEGSKGVFGWGTKFARVRVRYLEEEGDGVKPKKTEKKTDSEELRKPENGESKHLNSFRSDLTEIDLRKLPRLEDHMPELQNAPKSYDFGKESRESRETRTGREPRKYGERRESRSYRDRDVREQREPREQTREPREQKEQRESIREPREQTREPREQKEQREPRIREYNREPREHREFKETVEQAEPEMVREILEIDESTPYSPGTLIKKSLEMMNLNAQLERSSYGGNDIYNIKGEDLGVLIGKHGQTLEALQFIINLIVLRKTDSKSKITLDVEGYRSRREKSLCELAKKLAEKSRREKKNVVMEPMLPSERRIIHLTLQKNPNVYTFSKGEEPMRKVIIAPKKK